MSGRLQGKTAIVTGTQIAVDGGMSVRCDEGACRRSRAFCLGRQSGTDYGSFKPPREGLFE